MDEQRPPLVLVGVSDRKAFLEAGRQAGRVVLLHRTAIFQQVEIQTGDGHGFEGDQGR